MNDDEILTHYTLLGLRPGCSWDELRKAYRQQSRQWHPDRFVLPSEHKFATERMKAINHAYMQLSHHHKQAARLALDDVAPGSDRPPYEQARVREAPLSATPDTCAESELPEWRYSTPMVKPRSRLRTAFAVLAIGAVIVYAYTVHDTTRFTDASSTVDGGVAEFQPYSSAAIPGGQPENANKLSLGASRNEVLALRGPPDFFEGDTWYYGDLRVHFSNDLVISWDHRADRAARMPSPERQSAIHRAKRFQKGSTMEMVRAAQGEPSRALDTVWEYGPSRVYFRNGLVVSWYESPLMPLRIAR